ncbi:unnamed protein product [Prunus brigantina]
MLGKSSGSLYLRCFGIRWLRVLHRNTIACMLLFNLDSHALHYFICWLSEQLALEDCNYMLVDLVFV